MVWTHTHGFLYTLSGPLGESAERRHMIHSILKFEIPSKYINIAYCSQEIYLIFKKPSNSNANYFHTSDRVAKNLIQIYINYARECAFKAFFGLG
jgi:hypothetical protein